MSDAVRAVPGGYGPRYGPFSTYAPQPCPATYYSGHHHSGPDQGQAFDIPAGWDPHAVLRSYREAAAAAGAGWAIDSNDHTEEAS